MNWLYNTETWTTRDGRTIPLTEMEPDHRTNLLRMLYRKARRFHNAAIPLFIPDDLGDLALDALEQNIREIEDTEPGEWLLRQPLPRRLVELGAELEPAVAAHM